MASFFIKPYTPFLEKRIRFRAHAFLEKNCFLLDIFLSAFLLNIYISFNLLKK
ncbi:hypothetical protein CHCC20335_1935 [Bacillus paralicheniformis]|nr:hypothetical protein CHCC20335_1935 [Bacillus paralicheniformis]